MTSSGLMVFWPFGLLMSDATLAINLLTEIPADALSCNSLKIRSLISWAIKLAEGLPFLFSVTSKYASSNESGSTKSV